MYVFMIKGWWNLSTGSAPTMKAMLCKYTVALSCLCNQYVEHCQCYDESLSTVVLNSRDQ